MIIQKNPNIVIIAKNFNPTIFSQIWLNKLGIFSKEELEDNFVYTPMAVNATTEEVSFLAIPDKIQLSFPRVTSNDSQLIQRILEKIVAELPHTPFQAVGFNFSWFLQPKDQNEFAKINRKLFLAPDNPLGPESSEEDCRFGFYLSRNVEMGRLRLDIKPIEIHKMKENTSLGEGLQLTFNFNRALEEDDKVPQILNFLGKWEAAHSLSENMAMRFEQGWSS